jgi:hypothetical protein
MNHLTDEQLGDWLAGEASAEVHEHLRGCERCRSEATVLRDEISRYSLALRHRSAEAGSARIAKRIMPGRALALRRLSWAGVTALALLLAAQTGWMMRAHRPAPAPEHAAAPPPAPATMSDDELLEAVNNDLNRDVPRALAPVSAITIARNRIAAGEFVDSGNASTRQGERE